MDRRVLDVSPEGALRIIQAIGSLILGVAMVRVIRIAVRGGSVVDAVLGVIVIGGLGVLLLYGATRIPDTELRPEVYPRIAGWCLGGFGLLLVILVILQVVISVSPRGGSIDRPLFAVPLAIGLGGVGGFGIGINEAKAISRARAAEQRNQELELTERKLRETVEQLETSNERLEQFAYAASHDLQEPLRMVSSYLQLVQQHRADDLDEETEEYLEFAVDGADRMRNMIESLLEYSRINSRGNDFERTDAESVVDDVLDDLQLRIEETAATITVDELPPVTADPDQLAQVFRNLLLNALTYSGDEPPSVNVGADRVDDGWRFYVSDEGIGIDPEYHEQIFEVFDRLHTSEEYSGTGIGLAVCELIIDRHGGKIRVESEPGEGATFYFTLPAANEAPERGA